MTAAAQDQDFMRRAIALATPGLGRTGANPSVGCVIVLNGEIIAEGATGDGGRPHAEERAVEALRPEQTGAVAYVTLEPCGARSHGGLSCSERLVDAGVARVVIACSDPSPYAASLGPKRLTEAGIQVETGLLADEASALYRSYWASLQP